MFGRLNSRQINYRTSQLLRRRCPTAENSSADWAAADESAYWIIPRCCSCPLVWMQSDNATVITRLRRLTLMGLDCSQSDLLAWPSDWRGMYWQVLVYTTRRDSLVFSDLSRASTRPSAAQQILQVLAKMTYFQHDTTKKLAVQYDSMCIASSSTCST